ncbi:MAG: hypothetical protein II723_02970 [Oscillospiraceae bacterium]|nr:hypothetical protein [Oscillospiraceae bacterium]
MNRMIPAAPSAERLPARDYTVALLRRAAAEGCIPAERLEALRLALHKAAAANAAAYTRGRCSTVTRAQAEAFYRAVFYQLDAALLPLHSDSAALAALRDTEISRLLERGQQQILTAYAEAKEAFRRAYRLTQPFETVFFRGLLQPFAKFCTQYDARFEADAVTLDGEYPLLCRQPIPLGGVLGAHFYYTALLHEGELLSCFPAEEIHGMLTAYAARYLTTPDTIADNLAELVLRQWFGAALCGADGLTLYLPDGAADTLNDRFRYAAAESLCDGMRDCLMRSPLTEQGSVIAYVQPLLPQIAAELHRFFTAGRAAVILPAPTLSAGTD